MVIYLDLFICITILEIVVYIWNKISYKSNLISVLFTILAASRILKKCLVNSSYSI